MKELRERNVKSVFGGIGIASLLCVLMVLMSWSAMVVNSDINNEDSTTTVESSNDKLETSDTIDVEMEQTSFVPENFGFDEEDEMIGLRTENSKTYLTNDGSQMTAIHSVLPLHYQDSSGKLVDIDTSIRSSDNGYYVKDIYTPVAFGETANDGLSMYVGEDVILSGLNPSPVLVVQGMAEDTQLRGILSQYTSINSLEGDLLASSENVEVGGSSIMYPLNDNMDLRYHVSVNEVKQELVLDKLSTEVRDVLSQHLSTDESKANAYFGLQETMELPEDVELWTNGQQIIEGVELQITNSLIEIRSIETGLEIAYIEAPYAYDSSPLNAVVDADRSEISQTSEPNTKYFITYDGTSLLITTAVSIDWLLDDTTTFPVVIDPTVGTNTHLTNNPGTFQTCRVELVDCHTVSSGSHLYGPSSQAGRHVNSPRLDFTFTQTSLYSIEKITAAYTYTNAYSAGTTDYGGLLIMEDCTGTNTQDPVNNGKNLAPYYDPTGCTGVPLADYVPPTPPTNVPVLQDFVGFTDNDDCIASNDLSYTLYSMTSDMTTCDNSAVDFISSSSFYENGGIFDAGSYVYATQDSWGDGLNGATIAIQHRTVATSTAAAGAWFEAVAICDGGNPPGPLTSCAHGNQGTSQTPYSASHTVPAGHEMRLAYNCPSNSFSDCYSSETSFNIIQAPPLPVIPGSVNTASGSPTGSESPDLTFNLGVGKEAYLEFTSGNSGPGDAIETQIYYRTLGDTGWSTYWALCNYADATTPASNPPCASDEDYTSEDDVIFQVTGTYELLVWDTAGDGSGGGSGMVQIADLGSTTGVVPLTPSGERLFALANAEHIVQLPYGGSTGASTSKTADLCNSVLQCQSGTLSMFNDVYRNGANGGYIEFGLGWQNMYNYPSTTSSSNLDGFGTSDAIIDDFYLIIELQDNTADDDAPTVEYDGHYTGTTYVEGERTLFLSIMDTKHPINTASDSPTLHYSTDAGQTYDTVDATLMSSSCNKNEVCQFSATTPSLSWGTTFDYYWTFIDTALVDPTKVPNGQTPNAGRFPASGSPDLSFTVESIYNAPSTSQKLVTLIDNVEASEVDSTKNGDSIDRQITYFAETGEFLFEFDLSDCGLTSTSTSIYTIDDQCFFDHDLYGSISAANTHGQAVGHWDINWEGTANDCYPGAAGCTSAPTNTLELDSAFGGMLDIHRANGAGNFILSFDSTNNVWVVAGAGPAEISNRLDASSPDVVDQAWVRTCAPCSSPTPTQTTLGPASGSGTTYNNVVVPAGQVGRLYLSTASWGGEAYVTVAGISGTWNGFSNNANYYSTASGPFGTLAAGTYSVFYGDTYGDGSNGGVIYLQTLPDTNGGVWPAGAVETSQYSGAYAHNAKSFIIDLSDPTTPSLGTNTGFAGVPFGANAGEFSKICVSTAGHMIFMDSGIHCTPDTDSSSDGGTWQGFAIGSTISGYDYDSVDNMLWQIRDVEPDPDNSAPSVTGCEIGDSHSTSRKVSCTIADNNLADTGVDTTPIPGTGPTIYYTITGADGTVATDSKSLVPSLSANDCVAASCDWSYEFSDLTRGDQVDYYVVVRDLFPPGANVETTTTYDFNVANPTNTLTVEWHEYRGVRSYSNAQACSMQVVMYDVTNEFEFHYDETCYSYAKVGITGIRENVNNVLQVENTNPRQIIQDNPHNNNLRFTLTDSGTYAVEEFDLGMNFLPLLSSNQLIAPSPASGGHSNDDDCDSASQFASNVQYCANNFDIPDDFDFTFYGQSFDGSDPLNRIQVTASGVLHFVGDGSTTEVQVEANSGCFGGFGVYCDLDSGADNGYYPDMLMAPYWSREYIDECETDYPGLTPTSCEGIWYRTIPFDGQGVTVTDNIVGDTTWYALDSPIKVMPSDPSGYLAIDGTLNIEAGVEVIIGENMGISFDGGVLADGTCSEMNAIGTADDRITFTADTTLNANALWHGLAFTSDCGQAVTDRHEFSFVDFSNTNHAAITAGSRPADASGPSCGTATQDCDVGEFTMSDVTFSNVESAFSHGSGQGTVVTMENFAVTDARESCFNFAQNTVATLTGTASSPSTMTRCNTNNNDWAGAIASDVSGSTAGSLTMSYVDIIDSKVSAIKTDLQMVTISDVTVTTPTIGNQYRWTDSSWTFDNTGVSLGLTHGTNAEVVVTNFDAPNYGQGFICAGEKVSLTNVNLGTGFHTDHRFDIDPYCGSQTVGSMGANSVFDGVTAPDMTMYRTFPGTANNIQVSNVFKIAELDVSGGSSDTIVFDGINVGDLFEVSSCGSDVKLTGSTVARIDSLCQTPLGSSSVNIVDSTVAHTSSSSSAIYGIKTQFIVVNSEVTSSTIGASGPFLLYANTDVVAFLIDVDFTDGSGTTYACADANGKTSNCHTGKNVNPQLPDPEIYYGGFTNALSYRLGQDATTTPPTPFQIPEQGTKITASTLDSSGAELFPNKVLHTAITGADGKTTEVGIITGDDNGVVYDMHIIRASGAAGAGEVHPALADGTPATEVTFIDGTLQTAVPLPVFDKYTMDNNDGTNSYADIRLQSPPVTFNDAVMDCAWMATNDTFVAADSDLDQVYEFIGSTMVLAGDMTIDGCSVILEGSKLIFREDSTNNPTLTIGNGGSLIMKVDSGTLDLPKIYGEANLEAVEIVLESGSTFDMQAGTMKNFLLSGAGQLEVPTGATFNMAGGAYLTSSDLSTASNPQPVLLVDGGTVTVSSSAFIAGTGNVGSGVELVNGGQMTGDGLTVSNMATGIMNDGTFTMDSFTSDSNTNGVVADSGSTTALTNSQISNADVGVDVLGGADVSLDGLDLDDPTIAVRTAGSNTVSMSGLDVDGTLSATTTTYGLFTTTTSSGAVSISNSDFEGVSTALYLQSDSVSISDSAINNGDTGILVSSQSTASHVFDSVTLSGNDVSVKLDGTGTMSMSDVTISSVTTDMEISDSSVVNFVDGEIDPSSVVFATVATGMIDRDRSYVATLTADGAPLVNTNVMMSSKDAETTSSGMTDANGVTSGLSFSIYDLDASGTQTDYSAYYNTYSLSTVAMVSYGYTSETVNDGDFRYLQDQPTLVDAAVDTVNGVNSAAYALVDTIDVRVCGTNSNYVMVAPCDGTFSASSSRTFSNNMVEYGDGEGLYDGSSTMDLSGKVIMIDTGVLELRNGVNYILDGATIFTTGYDSVSGYSQWISEVPYGTTITMDGGEVNGVYDETSNGLLIGGMSGDTENSMNYEIDGVTFNNIAGIATGAGDRTNGQGSFGSFVSYLPNKVEITNSFIGHYRAEVVDRPTTFGDDDYCIRMSGSNAATISGNTFSDCIVAIGFQPSYYASTQSTVTHAVTGSNNVVIDGNTFVGTAGHNIRLWANSDSDSMTISNNVMTCATCMHVKMDDDSSTMPMIQGNTFNGGDWGVYTDDTEYVDVDGNTFNNIANAAIRATGGDVDVTNNDINDPGQYAIYLDSLEKASELVFNVVGGVNTDTPADGASFVDWSVSWFSPCGNPCTSSDILVNNDAGNEIVLRIHEGGSYANELRVNIKQPDNSLLTWDPTAHTDGEMSHESGQVTAGNWPSGAPLILDQVGIYQFNLLDTWGDGPNGGGFEVVQALAGSFDAAGPSNPPQYWDPGTANGALSSVYSGSSSWANGYGSTSTTGYSNTMDGVLLQNNGADPIDYEFIGIDTYGDGWHGNYMRFQVAPIGTWSTGNPTGYPPVSGNTGGGMGTTIGGIAGPSQAYPTVSMSGSRSAPLMLTLDPGMEMRFAFHTGYSYQNEIWLQITEQAAPDNSWVGPVISDNTITFDTANNDPNAVGLFLSNCDIQDYTITTQSNTITIGQNAVVNDGCAWNDQSSTLIGGDIAGSIGYNDDNAFNVNLGLDGTTISGFETGIYKSGGGVLELSNNAQVTAGPNGYGVHTVGIDVRVIDAQFDGGTTGTGIMIEDSAYAWLYPMDVTGNVGLHVKNSDILWDAGEVDADTILVTEGVTGTVQSLTAPAGSGTQPASASSTTMIDARSDTRLTVVDWSLDENKMLVDSSSVVDEANWLDIDANHLGAEPTTQVGLSIISDQGYSAYTSPVFETSMTVDGNNDDWNGGNELNPSGYAMPGSVGGPMSVTTDDGSLVLGFDGVSTATSDVYVYIDSNDMAGTSTGYRGVQTLPYDADYAIVVTSTGAEVYFYNAPNWDLNPTAGAISAEANIVEVSVPLSEIGGSSVNVMNIVATVQDTGTDDVTSASPVQSSIDSSTGLVTALDDAYRLTLNKLDLADGTADDEVLIHRSFEFGSTPTAANNYQVMVKTPAETRHTCDFDWATESNLVMDSTKSVTFDILRACPEITSLLEDIFVDEDTGAVTLDLATYVDDVQDVEVDMEWDVTGTNIDAFAGVLTDFADLTAATGVYTITPLTDQFGSFDMEFVVVDSHGQTDSETITYSVRNINDAPVICDARVDADPDCDNGNVYLYLDNTPGAERYNSRDEGFTSYSKPLGDVANDTLNSLIRDMANEQSPVNQVYTWGASATCDQIGVALQTNVNGVDEIVITENTAWEEGGVCDITLTLSDDGVENTEAAPVVVQFAVAPINDVPVIAVEGLVESTDSSNAFQGVLDGSYRLDLVEDTTDQDALTFDLSGIKSDIDHLNADLSWTLTDTNTCNSANYYQTSINGDTLEFTLIPDATTNAAPWEEDKLNNGGIHQTRTPNGRCEMTLTLSDTADAPSYMPNYTALPEANYVQQSVSVTLSVEVDNVPENVPDYFLDDTEGFSFNGVNNIMPGTYVPVDFTINAGGDQGPYTYNHLLVVSLHSDGHNEIELPRYYNPPAYGESLDIDDWEVYITELTTEVWVEIDVVTCEVGAVCTPLTNTIQSDNPESHNAVSSSQVFGKWSEPGRIGEDASGQQSQRRPAFEDKNWCNNMMTTNAASEGVAWSDASDCGHTEQGYNGAFTQSWQAADTPLPVDVTTIGALSVASFAPSIIAVALTGLFVSALVLAGRRDDDEEEFVEEKTISDDESAVSPVIATILMVAITVVLSGVVYVWAAQLADTDTKGVPRVTFDIGNVDTGDTATDHWKITIGQAQTVLATQAMEVRVTYTNATDEIVTVTTNLAATNQVYGFSPFNSDQLVTFGDVVTLNDDEVISSFSTGDDIYVKTHDADGTPLVDATIRIVYNPPGETQGAVLKSYTGLSWNQPI
jgi:flagellin-like protein